MRRWIAWGLVWVLLAGCAPKIGEDILIEPEGKLRLENTEDEIVLGVLSLLGVPVKNAPIRLGGDLKVTNRWNREITLISLSYTLESGGKVIARGEANGSQSVRIVSGEAKTIPIALRIDPADLGPKEVSAILEERSPALFKGEAVIEVWGFRRHYPFEKDATRLLLKALKQR